MTNSSDNVLAGVPDRRKYLELGALITCAIVLWWGPLAATLQLALANDAHTHILLVLPVSIALIYVVSTGMTAAPASKRWLGSTLMSSALLFRAITASNVFLLSGGDRLSVSMFALVIWSIGSVIFCLGLWAFQLLRFPLCFLFLLVPFPEHLLNWITEFLQNQSAWAASVLFHVARVPVTRDGILLSIPGLDIEVARECSSIRSSMMLFVTTLLLAHLFLRSRWRKSLLIAAVIPLSIIKNAVRIFTIAELGTRVDAGFLDGKLHHNGGIVFFSLAVFAELVMLWLLRRNEGRELTMTA